MLFGDLNDQQRRAVTAPLGPTLVVAGAGTGKTTVLAARYQYLVRECNIPPERILVVTFTRKASVEMRKRIEGLVPEILGRSIYISTFHKFSKTILEKSGQNFSICFPRKSDYYIKNIIQEELNLPIKAFRRTAEIIRKLKWIYAGGDFTEAEMVSVVRGMVRLSEEEALKKFPHAWMRDIYQGYGRALARGNQMDFDDILLKTRDILDDEYVRKFWDQQFQAILFDEFQDIDHIQFDILRKLSRDTSNLFCVGDPDQSIYGFRGVLTDAFDQFKSHFPGVGLYKLETNYRSTPEILGVANALININKGEFSKNLVTHNPPGPRVSLYLTNSTDAEEDRLIETILGLQRDNVSLRDCAILFRNNVFGNPITNKLLARKIPFISQDLYEFWRREEIKDMIAYLSIGFEQDLVKVDKAIWRIINRPNRGIGPKRQEEIRRSALDNGISIRETIQRASDTAVVEFWRLLKRIRLTAKDPDLNIVEQVHKILEFSGFWSYLEGRNVERFDRAKAILNNVLNEDSLDLKTIKRNIEEMTKYGVEKDQLYVGTIHGAKGLEFDHVFIMRLDEGKLPSRHSIRPINSLDRDSLMQEERRIAYVALTRARKRLYLSSSGGRENLSSFMREVEHLLDVEESIIRDASPSSPDRSDPAEDDHSEKWVQPDTFFHFDNVLEEDDPFGDLEIEE